MPPVIRRAKETSASDGLLLEGKETPKVTSALEANSLSETYVPEKRTRSNHTEYLTEEKGTVSRRLMWKTQ